MYWSWSAILEACHITRNMQHRFRDSISSGQSLPPKYEQCLQELEILLASQISMRAQALAVQLTQRSAFQRYFKIDCSDPNRVAVNGLIRDTPTKDPLFYILQNLLQKPDSSEDDNYSIITKWAYLDDHLVNTTHEDAARLDDGL
jgi:hypothetical protein